MAKRSGKDGKDPGKRKSASDYYKLNTRAVEDLATADESNSPQVSKTELERYGGRKKGGIPNWLKVCFTKFWFAGAVEFFMMMGLVGSFPAIALPENQILIVGIVMGMVTDLLTNNVLRFMAVPDGANDPWMMFAKKRFWTFFGNILYAMLLILIVNLLYALTDTIINLFYGGPETVSLMVEPLLFGLFYMLSDLALVGAKNLILKLVSSRKNKNV